MTPNKMYEKAAKKIIKQEESKEAILRLVISFSCLVGGSYGLFYAAFLRPSTISVIIGVTSLLMLCSGFYLLLEL